MNAAPYEPVPSIPNPTDLPEVAGVLALLGLASGGLTAILNAVTVLAAIAAIVLLWRRPSSEFFAAAGRRV